MARDVDPAVEKDIPGLLSEDGTWVSRRLFFDPGLYEIEKHRVFGRSWLMVGHDTQIPNPGDFFLSFMGEESVIVVRDNEGKIRVHLNSCPHRGMPVCREDRGHARTFFCVYHGWNFGRDGALVGLPNQRATYPQDFDKSNLGLFAVPRVETYHGLIFANHDAEAISLEDSLGDMKWYLDTSLGRREGGIEVLGVQKWRVGTNWKVPAENMVGDVAHAPATHSSVFQIVPGDPSFDLALKSVLEYGRNVALPGGHGGTFRVYPKDDSEGRLPGEAVMRAAPGVGEYLESVQAEAEERLGEVRKHVKIATCMTFPNLCSARKQLHLPRRASARSDEVGALVLGLRGSRCAPDGQGHPAEVLHADLRSGRHIRAGRWRELGGRHLRLRRGSRPRRTPSTTARDSTPGPIRNCPAR